MFKLDIKSLKSFLKILNHHLCIFLGPACFLRFGCRPLELSIAHGSVNAALEKEYVIDLQELGSGGGKVMITMSGFYNLHHSLSTNWF